MIDLETTIVLVLILAAAVAGRADSVAIAACVLLLVRLLHLDQYVLPVIEKSGMYWGLVLLIAAILVPIASGKVAMVNIKNTFTSWVGILALVLSFFTTYLSGLGLKYVTDQGNSSIMPSLIIGAVAAAAFMGGVPVGPLITSGLLALIVKLFRK
jgi:Predicted membrane protein